MIMETNKKLIAVVEIGGDKAVQFWARADDLAQQYNEKSTDIVYTVVKLPDSDNLTLVPSECVRIKIAEGKEE